VNKVEEEAAEEGTEEDTEEGREEAFALDGVCFCPVCREAPIVKFDMALGQIKTVIMQLHVHVNYTTLPMSQNIPYYIHSFRIFL